MAAKFHTALAQDPDGTLSVIEQGMDADKVLKAYKAHDGRAQLGVFTMERTKSAPKVRQAKPAAKKKATKK